MSLSVQMQRSYKSKNGNRTFVYTVSGKPSDIEAYREAQGEFYREDDKTNNPLWFTTKCIGKTGTLIITDNGNIVPDMSEYDEAASLAQQYGGNLGEMLAREAAQRLLGGRRLSSTSSSPAKDTDDNSDEDVD